MDNQLNLFAPKAEFFPKRVIGDDVTIMLQLTFENKGTNRVEVVKTPHTFFTGVDSVEIATLKEVAAFGMGWRDKTNNVVLVKCELSSD